MSVDAATKAAPIDVGKIAVITMAGAAVMGVLTAILATVKSLTWWQWIVLIVVLMLVISMPSVFIAWRKLRKRDLGPILNANGWAINAASYVRGKFAKNLTQVAKFPKLTAVDPVARRKACWRKFFLWLLFLLVAAFCFLFFTDRLAKYGIPFHKEKPVEEEVVEEAAAEPVAEPTLEDAAEAAAEAAPEE